MSAQEATLVIILKALGTKYQRVLALEKYIQHYGSLSQDAGEKVREILKEVES